MQHNSVLRGESPAPERKGDHMSTVQGNLSHRARMALGCALLGMSACIANATTVLSVGTAELTVNSGFIFHGTVTERWVAAGPKEGSIYTYLRFSVADVLKGAAGESVVLRFLGGTLNGRTLRVEGMKLPAVGEEGVFFVERLDRHQVYPFFGWDQGRFLVRTDAQGQKAVFTHDLRPVGRLELARASTGISTGQAAGVEIAATDSDAMQLDAFMTRVRDLVEAQQ